MAVVRALTDERLHADPRGRGLDRARRVCSQERQARETIALYERALA